MNAKTKNIPLKRIEIINKQTKSRERDERTWKTKTKTNLFIIKN